MEESAAQRKRIAEVLERSDTVVFVGSGVSMWSGLPSWNGLIEALTAFLTHIGRDPGLVTRELERGDLLQAASFGFMDLTGPERLTFLRETLRVGIATPSTLHRRIVTLGPTSFITTNYDKLLERALIESDIDHGQFRLVSTTNLVEVASIVDAQARDFVFKPHGDIDTIDAIVLTREDYRALRTPRAQIFEAMKMLMASRPVVFIGFGLRDPDFLLMKETLDDVFGGAGQDHYALMPDVDEDEARYWRANYGIHLVTYKTDPDAEGAQRHAPLLDLLDVIAAPPALPAPSPSSPTPSAPAPPAPSPAEQRLALLRHARRVERLTSGVSELIPLHGEVQSGDGPLPALFHDQPVVPALTQLDRDIVLVGQPGAGKSVVLRAAASALATTFISAQLDAGDVPARARVPLYIDLKAYEGDLWALITGSLPAGVDLTELLAQHQVLCVLDGVNEIAHEHLADNRFHDDLQTFLDRRGAAAVVVLATRFAGYVDGLDLPVVQLGLIDQDWLTQRLAAVGIDPRVLTFELQSLLLRPLYFRLFEREGWTLEELSSPHAIYGRLVDRLSRDATATLGAPVDLLAVFGVLAFARIDAGEQMMELADVRAQIHRNAPALDPGAVVDWLIGEEVLIAAPGDRLLFFHHSIAEYLAGRELARRGREDHAIVQRCLGMRQWDHALLLALGFLEPDEQTRFLETIVAVDPIMATYALRFIDDDTGEWQRKLLQTLAAVRLSFNADAMISGLFPGLRFGPADEDVLWQLAARENMVAAAALRALLGIGGAQLTDRVLDQLFAARDFNFLANVRLGTARDRRGVLSLLDRLAAAQKPGETVDQLRGLRMFVVHLLPDDYAAIARERWPRLADAPAVVRAALLDRAVEAPAAEGFDVIAELLPIDAHASNALVQWLKKAEVTPELIDRLDPAVIGPLLLGASASESHASVSLLRALSEHSDAWRVVVAGAAKDAQTVTERAVLCSVAGDEAGYFAALEAFADGAAPIDLDAEPLELLENCYESWHGHEGLLVALLRVRNTRLMQHLGARNFDPALIELDDLSWWLDWLTELDVADEFAVVRLAEFLATAVQDDDERVAAFLALFRASDGARRRALADRVLSHIDGLTFDAFSAEEIAWLVADLPKRPADGVWLYGDDLLGALATEAFVEETVLPALRGADGELRGRLLNIAWSAERRHGRRYVTDSGEPLS